MNRSNRREAIFRSDTDRQRFLGRLAELPERFRTEIHAFVLMGNHDHLVMRAQGRLDSPWDGVVGGLRRMRVVDRERARFVEGLQRTFQR